MYSTPLTKDVEGGCSNYLFITVWSNKKNKRGYFDVAKSTEYIICFVLSFSNNSGMMMMQLLQT